MNDNDAQQKLADKAPLDTPAPGTAGRDNTGVTEPAIEGGQPAVGEADQRENRNTEF